MTDAGFALAVQDIEADDAGEKPPIRSGRRGSAKELETAGAEPGA